MCKRCGKCKTPRWNYKERPAPEEVKAKAEDERGAAMEEWLG